MQKLGRVLVMVAAWAGVPAAGCVASDAIDCGNGLVCPADRVCHDVTDPDAHLCVLPTQVDVCAGKPRYTTCTTSEITAGRCYDGVCLAIGCGNSRVDRAVADDPNDVGEVCDDGNQGGGDNCSADCMSDETCGNHVIDISKGEACDDGNHVDHDGCNSTCSDEHVQWSRQIMSELPALEDPGSTTRTTRMWSAMAYDEANQQFVLFGGYDPSAAGGNGDTLGDTWIYDGHGWTKLDLDVAPSPRLGHTMAYDRKRHRVVLFGGELSGFIVRASDTWEWDGTRWISRVPATTPPARAFHSMVYDAKRGLVVVHGGARQNNGVLLNPNPDLSDTWLWDGSDWTEQVTTTHPGCPAALATNGRDSAAMAFDPKRGVAVLFGGECLRNGNSPNADDGDVWELDASGWKHVLSGMPSPGPRVNATMAFSTSSQHMLLFGGTGASEQWEWSGTAWTKATPTPIPGPRDYALAGTNTTDGTVTLLGGQLRDNTFDTQTWIWSGTAWTPRDTITPNFGSSATFAYDTRRHRAVVVDQQSRTYELSRSSWVQRSNDSFLSSSRLAYDSKRGVTVFFGSDIAETQTATWNGTTWTIANPATAPGPHMDVAMAYDAERDRVVLFGGRAADGTYLDETWLWDGATWAQVHPAHSPSARMAHSMAYDPIRHVTILFGGQDSTFITGSPALADTWTWDGTDWTQVATTGTQPHRRSFSTLAWQPDRARLLLVGGVDADYTPTDSWEWTGSSWSQVDAAPPDVGRIQGVLVPDVDGGGMLLVGGKNPLISNLAIDPWHLRWTGAGRSDVCTKPVDFDGDGLLGCADADCWYECTPMCPPGTSCASTDPKCGDGTCGAVESCHTCAADCGPCNPMCGDGFCDAPETATSCPGDCP